MWEGNLSQRLMGGGCVMGCRCGLGRGWLGVPDVNSVATGKERPRPPATKLKKQRWQWSNGTARGEYGGPPLSLEPAKPSAKPLHPLDTKDEFIWNIDWRPFLDREQQRSERSKEDAVAEESKSSSGYISFKRVMEINSIQLDLTKELVKPASAAEVVNSNAAPSGNRKRWRFASTRNERKQWDRAKKASETLRGEEMASVAAASASSRERERERYKRLKAELQLLTAGIGGAGTACAYGAYSPAVALSYGVGVLGSFVYVRMLGNSMDALGVQDVKGAVRGAVGQPRLLVPVILTMLFNRWNELLVPELGLAELHLIPMLLGFFTYKIATIVQVIQEGLPRT